MKTEQPKKDDFENEWKMVDYLAATLPGIFRSLLEVKHLYQVLNIESEISKAMDAYPHKVVNVLGEFRTLPAKSWSLESLQKYGRALVSNYWELYAEKTQAKAIDQIHFSLPPGVKLFCANCKRREAYNPTYAWDLLGPKLPPTFESRQKKPHESVQQVFVIAYQCQSCAERPEVFLICRNELILSIEGRSPMEVLEVPDVIPKPVKKYYRDAVLAFHCNQTLSGLFQLRTLVEQFARIAAGSKKEDRAEVVIPAYMATLPQDFKTRFPSFQELYDDLSAAVHAASEDTELFTDCRDRIDRHFDARRLFKIPDRPLQKI